MKILQVIDSLPATSGGSRFVTNLSKKLIEKGINVEVLLIDGRKTHFLEDLLQSGIKVHWLGENINRFHPRYIKQVATYLDKYDLVHVHIFPTSYIVALASLLNKKSAPIIFTEHSTFNSRATNLIFKRIENFIYSRFAKIIGITPEVKNFILDNLKVADIKIQTITNGVDIEKITFTQDISRIDLGFVEEDILILMAARFSKEKDFQTLIRSLTYLPEQYKLIMCGDGLKKQECEILVKNLNLSNRALFLGNRSDIYSIMKVSDINVLSSHYEGFGLSIVEAMAAKKPVVASNVPGMNNVVKDAGLLFEVGNDVQLAKHLLELGTNESYYAKISAQCFERAQQFSLDTMAEEYINQYNDTIKDKL
ncbi:glycosyltransferase [Acinetobacter indicus]|uniref:glycosyltransferase n=1 Tax=Acinetobacter indicus TaxID=756892 RepID=UPI0013B0988C|nr:glycosyltransferase [Acinetobacter indicus]QIC74735.1 glycosyltransferase [Acinetobacter indicus]